MIVPLANAIFNGRLDIKDFYKKHKKTKSNYYNDLSFSRPDQKIFPIIKIIKRVNESPSTPFIINSANEVLEEQFLKKKTSFLSISKIIMGIMKDRNYKKYAIRKPENIDQIDTIDRWARKTTLRKIINLKK